MAQADALKQRIVQELVPGKQITLAHLIANPDESLSIRIGLASQAGPGKSAIGVLTVTPAETAIILADIALKTAAVSLGHMDCHENGSLILTGMVSEVEAALLAILRYSAETLHYEACGITKT